MKTTRSTRGSGALPAALAAGRPVVAADLALAVLLLASWPAEIRGATLTYDLSVSGDFSGSGRAAGTVEDGITAFSFTATRHKRDLIQAVAVEVRHEHAPGQARHPEAPSRDGRRRSR